MGFAAYNRGTRLLAAQIAAEGRAPEFTLMDDLNATPRADSARAPFGSVHVAHSHGAWWVECPTSGFGYHYPTLRAALREWLVDLRHYNAITKTWLAAPRAA